MANTIIMSKYQGLGNDYLILAGITQLITVVLADKINHHEYIRSIKPLIA